jgi:hypothetical protein
MICYYRNNKPYTTLAIENNYLSNSSNLRLFTNLYSYAKPIKWSDVKKNVAIEKPATAILRPELKGNIIRKDIPKLGINFYSKQQRKLNNRRRWKLLKNTVIIISFYKALRLFTSGSKKITINQKSLRTLLRNNTREIAKFVYSKIQGLEEFIYNNFLGEILEIEKNNRKQQESFSKIKYFISKLLLAVLSNSVLPIDIPDKIKEILKSYINDGSTLPPHMLSTFEFNRLEFNIKMQLTNMTTNKKAMVLTYFIFYRVILSEIFLNITRYFDISKVASNLEEKLTIKTKSVQFADNDIAVASVPSPKNNEGSLRGILKTPRKFSRTNEEILKLNFITIACVFDTILKDVFQNTPSTFREYFKDRYVYRRFVIDGGNEISEQELERIILSDDIEFGLELKSFNNMEEFKNQNFRWISTSRMSIFTFGIHLVQNILN